MHYAVFNRVTIRVADTTDVSGRVTAESIKHGLYAKKQSSVWRICGLTIFGYVVSVCVLASLAPMPARAQGSPESTATVPRVGMLGEFKKKSLVGSWVETFTFVGGPRDGFVGTALVNYNSDGTLIGPQGGPITFDPDPAKASITSEGTGSWTQTEWNTFVYTSYALFSDFIGNVVGSLKVKGIYHLDLPSRDGYHGYSFYEVLDKDMKPLVPPVTGFVTNVGKRLTVDLKVPPLPPQP
jgi:hypothetical protein